TISRVIDEARHAVRGLRPSPQGETDDLQQAFWRVQQEFGAGGPEFRIVVEGRTRQLHPFIRDEVYRIGREALINAFRHSNATSIDIEIDQAAESFHLVVTDNGRGIDPELLQSGRDGHFGLSGIRERAERIGATLTLRSRTGAGTEVELFVP